MRGPGLFLKNRVFRLYASSCRAATAQPVSGRECGGTDHTTDPSAACPPSLEKDSVFATCCCPAQPAPSCIAGHPCWTVMTCYSPSMPQDQMFSTCERAADVCAIVGQAEVFGTPLPTVDSRLGVFRESCVQGLPEVCVHSSSDVFRDWNAVNETTCVHHIISDVPCDLALQCRSGLECCFEVADTAEAGTSVPQRTRLVAAKPPACYHCTPEQVSMSKLWKESHLFSEGNTTNRTFSYAENVKGNVPSIAARGDTSFVAVDPRARNAGARTEKKRSLPFCAKGIPKEESPGDFKGVLTSRTQSAHVERIEKVTDVTSVRKKVMFKDFAASSKEGLSAATHAKEMASEISKRLQLPSNRRGQRPKGVFRSKVFLAVTFGTMFVLSALFLWLIYCLATG